MKNYQLREIKRRYLAKKRRKQMILRLGITIMLVVVLVIVVVILFQKDELKGAWNYDETTVYQFDGDGKGKLVLPSKNYEFNYEINKNELFIDFVDEKARDFVYKFDAEEDALILVDEKGDEKVTYTMKREE